MTSAVMQLTNRRYESVMPDDYFTLLPHYLVNGGNYVIKNFEGHALEKQSGCWHGASCPDPLRIRSGW